jgi:molecular chaperone DnaK
MGRPVHKAVITVPAYFNDNQRQATKDAAKIAGLEVLRILNEPTAAALAYGFGRGLNQRVAVYDLGGGTFDISVLEIGDDVFEVLSTSGNTFLGGDDFDDRIIDLLADEFLAARQLNLRNDPYALEKLKLAAESAKKTLSVDDSAEVRIPDVISTSEGESLSLERTLTTAEFASLIADLLQGTFKVCDEALQQAGMVARDLDGVILVGGPTRLPIVRAAVKDYFQQDPLTDVDPDEVVAMGAAIHAASLTESGADAYLLDVTPLSLQIGVAGGVTEPVIERNTPVPIEQTRTFTTFKDHQESVSIRVYQGEAREANENELLGRFDFSGFDSGLRGEVEIDVTFEINTDGIVSVVARDRATGQEASTRITLSSGLSDSELEDIMDRGVADRVATARPEPQADAELAPVAPVPASRPATPPQAVPAPDETPEDPELVLLTDNEQIAGEYDTPSAPPDSLTTVNLHDADSDEIDIEDFDLRGDEIEPKIASADAPDAELEVGAPTGGELRDEGDFDEDALTNVEGLFDMSGDEFTDDSEPGA